MNMLEFGGILEPRFKSNSDENEEWKNINNDYDRLKPFEDNFGNEQFARLTLLLHDLKIPETTVTYIYDIVMKESKWR